jgi:fluoride exporter
MTELIAAERSADADVDLQSPRQRDESARAPWAVLGVISVGGAAGSLARFGIATAFPAPATGFPWATFSINVSGCLLIGVLMVLITEAWTAHRLVRPFLGIGVLGGFTTFSTYVVDIQRLVNANAAAVAMIYLLATVIAALAAVTAGMTLTRFALAPRRRADAGS